MNGIDTPLQDCIRILRKTEHDENHRKLFEILRNVSKLSGKSLEEISTNLNGVLSVEFHSVEIVNDGER